MSLTQTAAGFPPRHGCAARSPINEAINSDPRAFAQKAGLAAALLASGRLQRGVSDRLAATAGLASSGPMFALALAALAEACEDKNRVVRREARQGFDDVAETARMIPAWKKERIAEMLGLWP